MMENGILSSNAVVFTSASASLVNANIALNNMADGELFEMYNGFSEAYAHTLANRRYGTLADDLYDQNFIEIKGTTIEGSHSIYIETWRSTGVVDVESTIVRSGLFSDLWDTYHQHNFLKLGTAYQGSLLLPGFTSNR
jgi:hypothetical protein